MSGSAPVEISVAVHFDPPRGDARLVSDDGNGARAVWLPKSQTSSFHLTGKTTRGTDRHGAPVTLAVAHLTIPEWLANRKGLI